MFISHDVEYPKRRGNIFLYLPRAPTPGNGRPHSSSQLPDISVIGKVLNKKVLPFTVIILQIWRDTGRVLCFHQYLYQLIDLG